MARPPEERQAVRSAYIYDRQPLEEAAERANVPYATARKWKSAAAAEGDDWDKARAVASMTKRGASGVAEIILSDFLTLHASTMEALQAAGDIPALDRAEAMSRLADAFTKTMNAVAKAAPDLGRMAVAMEVMEELVRYVREEHEDQVQAFVDILEPFAVRLAEKFG